jgi:NAD(P)-dependent dehydrogenase (short-subunit alcohol dehydrogenase family)
MSKIALIVGAGSGNSAAFARALAADDYKVVLAARNIAKLDSLCSQIDAQAISCDATSVDSVRDLFDSMRQAVGSPDVVLYNASAYTAGPITNLDPELVLDSLMQTAYCDGQVCLARPGTKPGTRTWAREYSRGTFHHRRWDRA